MSIIYEALKKVEQSKVAKPVTEIKPKPGKRGPRFKSILIYFLIAAVGIFLVNFLFKFISKPRAVAKQPVSVAQPARKAPPPVSVAPEAVPQSRGISSDLGLNLSGVFYSGDEAYALLNNQITKVNDVVGGAVVKRISLEGVELEKDGQLIVIPSIQK
jgi:hypothetical protein